MDAIYYYSKISTKFDNHYNKSSLFRERFIIWTSIINKYIKKEDLVLDAGCGSGIFSFYIAKKGNKVTAFDGSAKMINLCEKKILDYKNIDVKFLIEKLPFNGVLPFDKFDFIISSSVLEYISDYKRCLDDFKTLLKTNGILVISLPNKDSIYRKLEKITYSIFKKPKYFSYVINMSTVKELNAIMEENGFEILENKLYSSDQYLNKILKYAFIPKNYRSTLFLGVYKKI